MYPNPDIAHRGTTFTMLSISIFVFDDDVSLLLPVALTFMLMAAVILGTETEAFIGSSYALKCFLIAIQKVNYQVQALVAAIALIHYGIFAVLGIIFIFTRRQEPYTKI